MSDVAGTGIGEGRAKSRGAGFVVLAGLIVLVHLAALAVLFSTEYGPFAITLSVLAWVLVNCFLLAVLQRPGVCAALALALIATQTQIVGWAKRSVPTIPLLVLRDGGHGAYAPLPTLRNPGLLLAHLLPKPLRHCIRR